MKKALVTGAAGFIGLSLCEKLISLDIEVYGIDNFSRGKNDQAFGELLKLGNFHFLKHDLTNGIPSGLDQKFDFVFHLAGVVGVENVLTDPYRVFKNNLEMIFETLDWVKTNRPSSFVYLSSSEAYGWNSEISIPTPEEVNLVLPKGGAPRGGYALSKMNGEYLTELVCREAEINYSILRPHNIYGPRMGHSHVIPQLFQKIKNAQDELVVKNPDSTRAFCFISDAIEQMICTAMKPVNSTVNIGDDSHEIKMGELAQLMISLYGADIPIISDNETPDPFPRRFPDLSLNKKLFGPIIKTKLETGLKMTIDWYKANQ